MSYKHLSLVPLVRISNRIAIYRAVAPCQLATVIGADVGGGEIRNIQVLIPDASAL